MAVGAIQPIQPNVYDGGIGISPPPRNQAGQVYGDMSYPPPPQNLVSPDMGLPHSELPGPYSMASQSESSSQDGPSNWTLQRSFSTPDAASMGDQQHTVASGEKKRNKLGYHRTSVACSHCRGRKIRCIPAANDAQGRCASCIRLKRECSFKPTEQQRGTEARSRSAAHSHIEQRSSQSSSPTPSGHNSSQPPPQRQFPPLTTSTSHMRPPMSAPPTGDGMAPLPAGHGQQYDFNQGIPGYIPSNINPYLDPAPPSWNNPWPGQQMDSPISEHPPDTPLSATWTSGPGSQDAAWSGMAVPVRSMSYGGDSIGNNPYGTMLPGGRHPPGYVNGPVSNSSVEGFQLDAGSTASMATQASMRWQPQSPMQRPPQGYGNWHQGDAAHLQPGIPGQTASGADGTSSGPNGV